MERQLLVSDTTEYHSVCKLTQKLNSVPRKRQQAFFLFTYFETESCYTGPELTIFLSQPPEGWGYSVLPCPAPKLPHQTRYADMKDHTGTRPAGLTRETHMGQSGGSWSYHGSLESYGCLCYRNSTNPNRSLIGWGPTNHRQLEVTAGK